MAVYGTNTKEHLWLRGDSLYFRSEPRRHVRCTVEPMKHDIEPVATSQIRGTTVSLACASYSLYPHAQHRLQVLKHEPKRTRGPKILVIDDDPDLCLGLRIRLQRNYETYCANDAGAGLSVAFSEMPDVIILDIGLPDYDGYFFMRSLSEIPGLAGVPVIVLTARDRFTHERRCYEAGAKLFFQKPIDNRGLLAAIEQLVG